MATRRLLAVVFADIVGYSALVNADERRALRLLEAYRAILRRQCARHGGTIVDTVGDGCLMTFANALEAVECGIRVQSELAARNAQDTGQAPLRARIGLHLGDVEQVRRRVFGDGVNVAARVEPLAPAGGLAATAPVVAQIHGPLRAAFVAAGPRQLKNIAEPHEIFLLEEAGIAVVTGLLAPPRPWRRLRRWGAPAAAAAVAAALLTGASLLWHEGVLPRDDASIAVLPLQNLSGGDESADFVAGLHDSLLTEIASTPELKVISRTSVLRYARDPPPVPEIGRQLNVSYILEGSVQRQGQRVRVNVQLIRTRDDQHVWARVYERDAGDLFELQTDISRAIAQTTQGRVLFAATPASRKPTQSVEAYELYLRAIAREARNPGLGREPPGREIGLLEQAIALDPDFALAYAALARYQIWGANWAGYSDPARRSGLVEAAARSAGQALALQPRSPEALTAAGLVEYWKQEDLAKAARLFEDALRARPADPVALFWLAALSDSQGDVSRSQSAAESLLEVDPYNEGVNTLLAQQYLMRRDYQALAHLYLRWRAFSESPAFVDYWNAELAFYQSGDLLPWKQFLAQPPGEGLAITDFETARFLVAMYERRFADAAATMRRGADTFVAGEPGQFLAALYAGLALEAGGDRAGAQPYLSTLVTYLRGLVAREPDRQLAWSVLALAEGALGQERDALNHARHAVELSAPTSGRSPGRQHYEYVLNYAQLAARFGRKDEALQRLDWLLRQPSGVHAHAVRLDPLWAPLDRDADFQALVGRHLPPRA